MSNIPRHLSVSNRETLLNTGRDIPVTNVKILQDPQNEWKKICYGKSRVAHSIEVDWKRFNLNDYIFTHDSIVSSVETEANGYYIKPVCSKIVNLNGNAWTNAVLLATFRTFVGGYNFQEHIQIPSQSKGTILDAVLRPFQYRDEKGNIANVYICDILVATSKCNWDLVQDIQTGKLRTLSMGTQCRQIQCSRCGKIFADDEESCDHIKYELGQTFIDENGIERVIAELCGCSYWDDVKKEWIGDPESNTFIEASWVKHPAYVGAVVNHFINPKNVDPSAFRAASIENAIQSLFNVRVADRYGRIARSILTQEKDVLKRQQMIDNIIRGK
ncbi:MAG: hypothetical protein M0P12_00925 [Paludibacteraceae bacterium]|nr:hypothetical protein [Paludibacteraceae bacterium]MCK9615178.1 hypothetical protein [Candidatus Omnitrophota bacterium]